MKKRKIPNINARDFATILGYNPYQTAYELLEDKIEKKHLFFGNKFTDHGNKYEKIALKAFEDETGYLVNSNQNIIKHPEYEWITGKVDGIVEINEYNDKISDNKKRKRVSKKTVVVEVKCPLKEDRKEELTEENIPKHYWSQCQVYMNILDIEYVYYLEYYIIPNDDVNNAKMYYIKVFRDNNWWEENLSKIIRYYDEMKKYIEIGDLNTHPVRIIENQWKKSFE